MLAIFPALGLGVAGLVRSGQLERLSQYEWRSYATNFDGAKYFSYETGRHDLDRITVVPRPRAIPPRVYSAALPFLHRRAIADCQVLLVTNLSGALAGVIAKRLTSRPLVVQVSYHHEAVARAQGHAYKVPLLRALLKLVARSADGVIVPSVALQREVADAGYRGMFGLIPNGVDLERFSPSLLKPEPGVLYVGRVSPEKNLVALALAVEQVKGMSLRVVNRCSYADMPSVFRMAPVFALLSDTEGCSKVLIEAMACGLPCVVSRGAAEAFPGAPLMIVDDVNDTTAVAAAIRRALKDTTLGSAARAYVEKHHDIRRTLFQEIAFLKWVGRP